MCTPECTLLALIKSNSRSFKRITGHQKPTDYFPHEEFAKILDATYRLDDGMERTYDVEKRDQPIRAMVGLLRWSGLRIRDAVTLEKTRLLPNDDIFLYKRRRACRCSFRSLMPSPKIFATCHLAPNRIPVLLLERKRRS